MLFSMFTQVQDLFTYVQIIMQFNPGLLYIMYTLHIRPLQARLFLVCQLTSDDSEICANEFAVAT